MDLFLNDNLFILIIYLAAAADAIKTNVYHFKRAAGELVVVAFLSPWRTERTKVHFPPVVDHNLLL